MTSRLPDDTTDPRQDGASDEPTKHTRRSVFKYGGGAVAAATFVGLTSSPAAASDSSVATQASSSSPRRYSTRDPHAKTGRRAPYRTGTDDASITILPIDNAKFRAGGRFDLRVEVAGVNPINSQVTIDVSGPSGPAAVLTKEALRPQAAGDEIVIVYPKLTYPEPGDYTVTVTVTTAGEKVDEASVTHTVAGVGEGGAKNVVFFLGDGMGGAAITGARLLSKGMKQGKYRGLLAMDTMENRGLVGTSGADSIATDSANSMSAYMCGHKSSVNAMGVYESSETVHDRHPHVETMAELVKRTRGMGVGVVTTAEVQDATPAAVFAHTRQRSEYIAIMDQALEEERRPDVLLGGGLASLLPKSHEDSRRDDDRDLVEEFQAEGYAYATTRSELASVAEEPPERLLGMFHTGNMNVYLDREQVRDPDVLGEWDDQPTLMEMTSAALSVLEKNDNGFFLMVEAASIDKMEHPLDGPRAVYDTIELDQTLQLVRDWAADRDDTLIVVTADHNHAMSIVGTHDRNADADGRDGNGVYGNAGFPSYSDADGDGFPDDPDPEVGLFFGWSNHPDHTDDFEHNHTHVPPAVIDDETGKAVPNPDRDPDAEVQQGNLPGGEVSCVHTVEDVSVFASGPGSHMFNAFVDNTEVFHHIVDALAIDATG